MQKIWGYARVSTKEQNLDRQINAIKEHYPKISDEDIYQDKKSGKNFDREAYTELKKVLREGDSLILKDTERLGRNKELVKEELSWMKKHGIKLRILNIPTTLTDLDKNDWLMDMVSTILIEVYTSLAEQDYNERREKQEEGIKIAKIKGKYIGRQPKQIDAKKFMTQYRRIEKGEIELNEAAKILGIHRMTLYRKIKQFKEGNTKKWLK